MVICVVDTPSAAQVVYDTTNKPTNRQTSKNCIDAVAGGFRCAHGSHDADVVMVVQIDGGD